MKFPAGKAWPKEYVDFIKQNYIGVGHQKMADMLNEHFGTAFTKEQIKGFYARHKLNSGLTGYFKKGHVPANKGQKGVWDPRCEKTWFKEGNFAPNRKPIGSERLTKDGYLAIKIQDFKGNGNWKEKHRVIWEEKNGPIPRGHCVIFLDGDKTNITIDNLALITQNENRIMNKKKLRSDIPEVTEAYINLTKLQIARSGLKKRKRVHNDKIR